jgi:L-aminopeptidase/D-esterase-like protein
VLFDLAIGDHRIRPDQKMGYQACLNARSTPCAQGSVGAGTGATVGKIRGPQRSMKSGLGCYALDVDGLQIGALIAVNSLGDILDPQTGRKLAGPLNDDMQTLGDTEEIMIRSYSDHKDLFSGNTTLGVVATNAALTKAQATKIASMAHDGYARALRPAHSMYDGDTIFTMSTGAVEADPSVIGLLAARVTERAIAAAVRQAKPLCGLKCYGDLQLGAGLA